MRIQTNAGSILQPNKKYNWKKENLQSQWRKLLLCMCAILGMVCALATMPALTLQAEEFSVTDVTGVATIQADALNVRTGPGKEYEALGKAKAGEEYMVTGESGGWYRIDYNGTEGYVTGEYVQFAEKTSDGDSQKTEVPEEEVAPIPGLPGIWQKIKSGGIVPILAVVLIPIVLIGLGFTVHSLMRGEDDAEDFDEEDFEGEEEFAGDEGFEGDEEHFDERAGEAYLSREVAPFIEEEERLRKEAEALEARQEKQKATETDEELQNAMEKLAELQKEIERIKKMR